MKKIRMGTRGSLLATTQAGNVKDALERVHEDLEVELVTIKTQGDRFQKDEPFASLGAKGIFVKELDEALLERRVDFAVHSMKDLPAELEKGIVLGCVPKAEDPRDAIISEKVKSLEQLKAGMCGGTASVRRQALLESLCPGIRTRILRGNLDTRIRKLHGGDYDFILVAAAGMHRLGRSGDITAYLDPNIFTPAPCQGILGITTLEMNRKMLDLLAPLNEDASSALAMASRRFLEVIQGGCQVPLGLYFDSQDGVMQGSAFLATSDAQDLVRVKEEFETLNADVGEKLAQKVLNSGGQDILARLEREELG